MALSIIFAVLNAVLMCLLVLRIVHVLQLGGYRTSAILRWLKNTRFVMALFVLSLIGLGSSWVTQLFLRDDFAYIGLALYFFLGVMMSVLMSKQPVKVHLKFTYRVGRLMVLFFILTGATGFALLHLTDVQYLPLLALTLPLFVMISNIIISPVESLIRQRFITKARHKLFSPQYKNLIRIGITGSYGKTKASID